MDSQEKLLLKDLAKRYFIGKPVKIGQKIEGQKMTKQNAFRLGCYAGPDQKVEHLFHEMCHLAEREPEKLLEKEIHNWNFEYGKYWNIAGKQGYEQQTDQSVLREARVWSFQLSLMREHGLDPDPYELVSSAVYIPAFCYFSAKQKHSPSKEYSEKERESVNILSKIVEKQTAIFTAEKFEEDWNYRLDLVAQKNKAA